MGLISAFTGINRYVAGGALIAIGALSLWALRLESLRAGWAEDFRDVQKATLEVSGRKTLKRDNVATEIRNIGMLRDVYKAERDGARQSLSTQSLAVKELERQSEASRKVSAENRAKIRQLLESRAKWIAKAEAAATRTERLSAEEEIAQCERAMDELFNEGF